MTDIPETETLKVLLDTATPGPWQISGGRGPERSRIALLTWALRRVNNMGQSAVPDHWDFRCRAREIARAALEDGQ